MECFIRRGEKCLAEIKNSRRLLIYSNRKSRPALPCADRLFDILGTLSAPRFRSVLSHKIYRRELERLYTEKGRPGIPFPAGLSLPCHSGPVFRSSRRCFAITYTEKTSFPKTASIPTIAPQTTRSIQSSRRL